MHTIYVREDILNTSWACDRNAVLNGEWHVIHVNSECVGFRNSEGGFWYVDPIFVADNDLILLLELHRSQEGIRFVSEVALRDSQSKIVFTTNENNIECDTCHRTLSLFGLIGDTITCDSCGTMNSIKVKDEPKEAKATAIGRSIHIDPFGMWRKVMP